MHIAYETIVSLLSALLSLVHLSTAASGSSTTGPALPQDIRAALERNARELSNIRLDFVHQERPLIPETELASQLGCDVSYLRFQFARRRSEMRLQGHLIKARDVMEDGTTGEVIDHAISTFDGVTWFNYRSFEWLPQHAQCPQLLRNDIQLFARLRPNAEMFSSPYLALIGIEPPFTGAALAKHDPVRSLIMKLIEAGETLHSAAYVSVDSKQVYRIELDVPDRFYQQLRAASEVRPSPDANPDAEPKPTAADSRRDLQTIDSRGDRPTRRRLIWLLAPDKGFAMSGYEERWPDRTLLLQVQASEFFQPPARTIWLPRKVLRNTFAVVGTTRVTAKPLMQMQGEVVEVDTTPADLAEFSVKADEPGTLVFDLQQDGELAESDSLAPLAQTQEQAPTGHHPAVPVASGSTAAALVLGGLIGVALVVALAVRRSRFRPG